MVDDNLLEPMYYTSREGSTVIELAEGYTKKLGNGEHTLTVAFSDGTSGAAVFKVSNSPKTGDEGVLMWMVVGCVCAGVLVRGRFCRRRGNR